MFFKNSLNKNIYFEVYGSGKPLLILNGIMMSTQSWKPFIEELSRYNKLILLDFLDQGQSDKMDGMEYDHSVHVNTIVELLRHLGIDKTSIYGVSYGAEIALQFAILFPYKLEKLMVFNTTSKTSYWLAEIGHNWNAASKDPLTYYLTTIPSIYSPKFFETNKEWMESRKEVLLEVFANPVFINAMIRLTNSSESYDVSDKLHKIKAPTLVVGCEYDFITPYYEQKKIAEKINNSQLVFVPDSGHALMYEKPTLFVSLVLGFLLKDKEDYTI